MKKLYLILFVFLFPFLIKNCHAQDTTEVNVPKKSKKQPEFKFETEEINFGEIHQGDSITVEFKFTNTGKTPLVILGAEGSCGCTVVQFPREPILRGEQKRMPVIFYSAGKSGLQDKSISIYSNAMSNPKEIRIKGYVLSD